MLYDAKKLPNNVFPLVWGVIQQGKKKPLCVGACTKTWKPFFIGNMLHVIAYQNFSISQDSGECQFSSRCLNLDCELNKTTFESYFRQVQWQRIKENGLRLIVKNSSLSRLKHLKYRRKWKDSGSDGN